MNQNIHVTTRGLLALGTLLALACTAPSGAAGRATAGGMMNEPGVLRIGSVTPGRSGAEREGQLDATPIVLWSGDVPAAVFTYRTHEEEDGPGAFQEIAPIPESLGGRRAAAFPFTVRIQRRARGEGAPADTMVPAFVLTADVDGNGTEELIVARRLGGVDVLGLSGPIGHLPGLSGDPAIASYTPVGAQAARLTGRAVVHLLLRRELHVDGADAAALARIGAAEPFAVIRVDGAGAHRLRLSGAGFAPTEVVAVGAVNPPGADGVTELLVVSRQDAGGDLWVSRHRPDGALLDRPRKIYVPVKPDGERGLDGWQLDFLPQSRTVVLAALGSPRVYFLEAEKPANWIRMVDLAPVVPPEGYPWHLGAVGAGDGARALTLVDGRVYAVDAQGRYHGPASPLPKPGPFFEAEAKAGDPTPPLVIPSAERPGELLVVRSRPRTTRKLGREEIAQAADRFVTPELLARTRAENEPTLLGDDPVRDRLIAEERERRNAEPPKTLEEWRRTLPDSWAAYQADRLASLDSDLKSLLLLPLEKPATLASRFYREPNGLQAWLAALDLPPETTFEIVRRGAVVKALRIPGAYLDPQGSTDLRRQPIVAWRSGSADDRMVTTLVMTAPDGSTAAGVYQLRIAEGSR